MWGAANLSILIEQHQLISFGAKFRLFASYAVSISEYSKEFRLDNLDYEKYVFLPPVKSHHRLLTGIQIKHLQQHYRTVHDISSLQDQCLRDINTYVQVWHYCCNKYNTIFHCEESHAKNMTRLNHFVCIDQTIDRNAHVREGTRLVNRYGNWSGWPDVPIGRVMDFFKTDSDRAWSR